MDRIQSNLCSPLSDVIEKLSDYEIGRNELANRNCEENKHSSANMSLEDLPNDLILSIISKLDYSLHNRIRCASKGLNKIYTQYMMHVYRVGLHISSTRNGEAGGVLSPAYQLINTATEHFLACGYESQFCGSLVALHFGPTVDSFSPHTTKLCSFLMHFYEMVERNFVTTTLKASSPLTSCNRIGVNRPDFVAGRNLTLDSIGFACTLTLMNLLKKFKNFCVCPITKLDMHVRIVLELRGIYLGVLLVHKYRRPQCFALLSIIAELLHDDLMQQSVNRMCEQRNTIYVYGASNPLPKLTPCTYFEFNIHASAQILHIICSMFEDEFSEIYPQKMSNYFFIANLEIRCKKVLSWGCCDTMNLELGSFGDSIHDLYKEDDEKRRQCSS